MRGTHILRYEKLEPLESKVVRSQNEEKIKTVQEIDVVEASSAYFLICSLDLGPITRQPEDLKSVQDRSSSINGTRF